jgi:hypothetical protein
MTDTEPPDSLAASSGITNPMVLLDRMIERGVDPDALKKMMDLAEHWERNRAIKAFNTSMVACQKAMPTVVRDAENAHTKKRYALRETINNTIKPCYTGYGFSLSFSTADCPLPEHVRIVVEIGHEGGDIRTRHFDIPLDGKGAKGGSSSMNAPQATGSTYSYGCRYATCLIFNVTIADEDVDGQSFLSSGQIMAINNAIEALRNAEAAWTAAGQVLPEKYTPFNSKRFYDVYLAKGLADFPAAKFDDAMDILDRKLKQLRKDGAP